MARRPGAAGTARATPRGTAAKRRVPDGSPAARRGAVPRPGRRPTRVRTDPGPVREERGRKVRGVADGRRLAPSGKGAAVYQVGRHEVPLTNLAKVMYPRTGFTKGDLIQYYARIAPVLLPHMEGRPVTLKRYPDGVEGEFFYQKSCPANRPDWLGTADVWSEGRGEAIRYCLANDLESLVWLANAGNLELHTFLHRSADVSRPDMVVFDLDPGPPADVVTCCDVALRLRDHLKGLGLRCFPKVSGGKGMQLYIPLHTQASYAETKPFARAVADAMMAAAPGLVTSNMRKELRKGKVFIDWSQNDTHKTTVCVYSLRAQPVPRVSCPVTWSEVERGHADQDDDGLRFSPDDALERVRRRGDLFAPVLRLRQRLPS